MKITKWLATVAISVICLPMALAVQEDVFSAMRGQGRKAVLKLSELPDDAIPVRLATGAGGGGLMDMLGGMMPLMMIGMMGGKGGDPQSKMLQILDIAWVVPGTVQLGGKGFLVTYKADVDLFGSGPEAMGADLSYRLTYVDVDSIKAVTPMPDYTKKRVQELLTTLKAAAQGGGMAEVAALAGTPGEGAATTVPPSPQESAERAASGSNMKQLALGMMMYMGDYDDRLPYAESTAIAKRVTMPYIKSESVWNDPEGIGYRFNVYLAGVDIAQVQQPAEIALYYQAGPAADGLRWVAFADGHAKRVREVPLGPRNYKRHGKPLPPR